MPEDQVERLNQVIDLFFTRIMGDIQNVPADQLPNIAQALIIFIDYKNALQTTEGSAQLQDKIYRMMIQRMNNGEGFGVNIIQPPGEPPIAPAGV